MSTVFDSDWIDVGAFFSKAGTADEVTPGAYIKGNNATCCLPLKSRHVAANVDCDLGIAQTTETFHYVHSVDCSPTFKFPLPPRSAVYK
jgi:hypothetical protein